ncbi:hypothetical protein BLA29_014920, partial [Euroglyphus maynei]
MSIKVASKNEPETKPKEIIEEEPKMTEFIEVSEVVETIEEIEEMAKDEKKPDEHLVLDEKVKQKKITKKIKKTDEPQDVS